MLYPICDGAVHEFCLIVGGEGVAIRGGMEATFKNYNHVFLVGALLTKYWSSNWSKLVGIGRHLSKDVFGQGYSGG